MKNIKKHWVTFLIVFTLIGIISGFGFYYFNNQRYAQKLLTAIDQENITELNVLMKSPFGNLNSKPSFWVFEVISETVTPTPLQAACKAGNPEIVKILLENGADVNYTYWDKMRNIGSPLTNAAGSLSDQRLQVIKLLVEYGADVNYVDSIGNDALLCALYASLERNDTIEIIEYLENQGANIYKRYSGNEDTILHKACECDCFIVVQYLIDQRGFDINSVNTNGDTPLISFLRYASNRKEKTLLFLVQEGANQNIKNKEGKTAYDYAIERHPEFLDQLCQGDRGQVDDSVVP